MGDYTDAEIKANFDMDIELGTSFATDIMAETLWTSLTQLGKMCDTVIADGRARKVRLDNAIIGWVPKEELEELQAYWI